MDAFLNLINGKGDGEEELEFDFDDDDDEDGEYDYDDAEFYEPGDIEFTAESETVSGLDIDKITEAADIPYEVKLDYEFLSNLRKMFRSISRDFDYVSYQGGKNATETREIDVNGYDYTLSLALAKSGDGAPFVITVKLTRK